MRICWRISGWSRRRIYVEGTGREDSKAESQEPALARVHTIIAFANQCLPAISSRLNELHFAESDGTHDL